MKVGALLGKEQWGGGVLTWDLSLEAFPGIQESK